MPVSADLPRGQANAATAAIAPEIAAAKLAAEETAVEQLLGAAGESLPPALRRRARRRAGDLVTTCRQRPHRASMLDSFLHEFGLSTEEGTALMCLAEALLRVPDETTADRLIAEKIAAGDWSSHRGRAASPFLNASVWGLMLSGRMVRLEQGITGDPGGWLRRLIGRLSEPVVRQAMLRAMRILAGQFVLGATMEEALERAGEGDGPGSVFSFDMLGEGARTEADADRYFEAYRSAIEALAAANDAPDPFTGNGISVKLSALHPRFEPAQHARVMAELAPRLLELAQLARRHDLGFSIDAEEASRLELSMELFAALAHDPSLAGWDGLGFVLQAYQKRARPLADWLCELAVAARRRIPVRLVKGAYWDTEIKRAQQRGLADYPVFTRKVNTDLSYAVCAARLIAAGERIFPQFASHNAHTLSLVLELVSETHAFEFQRLHGMGELLYEVLYERLERPVPLRVYAPVGSYEDLLPYLVRRLLENGANSSFVNRFLDADVPVDTLFPDLVATAGENRPARHPEIPVPRDLYRDAETPRLNAAGIDLDDQATADALARTVADGPRGAPTAGPIVGGALRGEADRAIVNPGRRRDVVGRAADADERDVDDALTRAAAAQSGWDARGGAERAAMLEAAADRMEADAADFIALIVAEGGRTIPDAIAEVREAQDFCRYYAAEARRLFTGARPLTGPTGERNTLSLHGRGVFACVSPWNFPLAIFTGQVAAALAAGNAVVAKPAEQTPLVAAKATRLFHAAGVPGDVLHLLTGPGETIGARLTADPRVAGVAFTGSIATARRINRALAERPGAIPALIAETGGQNAMIVDSTALPEQVVDAVVTSAFLSAGQRCSALRVLYLQREIADEVLEMLSGAMASLTVGDPADLATDVGPVIDEPARAALCAHIQDFTEKERLIAAVDLPPACAAGTFVAPHLVRIESVSELPGEVFGPVLHVVRYAAADLDRVLAEINDTGFGLTLGIQSRIGGFADAVSRAARVGNTYVNRDMVGAVVGVNPFGGEGLSGTGPKAGGPHYLLRFATERTRTDNLSALGGDTRLFELGG